MKKNLVLLFLAAALSVTASASDWITDMDEAKEIASAENKYILINFTGSDWCGWCKRLDREVFREEAFLSFAADNLVLLRLDFPKHKKQDQREKAANERLRRQFGVNGFPTIILADARGGVIMRTGYQYGGAQAYVEHLSKNMPRIN